MSLMHVIRWPDNVRLTPLLDELKRPIPGLVDELEREHALYPVSPETKQPVRPIAP